MREKMHHEIVNYRKIPFVIIYHFTLTKKSSFSLHKKIYQKIAKKLSQRQNIDFQIYSSLTPASDLKKEHPYRSQILQNKKDFEKFNSSEKDSIQSSTKLHL